MGLSKGIDFTFALLDRIWEEYERRQQIIKQADEDMKKQVEGIEKDEKKKICSQLIGLVVPEQLAEQVNASICQDYGQTFKNQWDSQNMYKKMYYAYITELKYFAKSLEKGEA